MKKIYYEIKPSYKVSVHDMSIDINFIGHIVYRKKKYNIISRRTHEGPIFDFEYYEVINDSINKILNYISPILVKDIVEKLKDFPNIDDVYGGMIEYNGTVDKN
jgi:hypothetical protein